MNPSESLSESPTPAATTAGSEAISDSNTIAGLAMGGFIGIAVGGGSFLLFLCGIVIVSYSFGLWCFSYRKRSNKTKPWNQQQAQQDHISDANKLSPIVGKDEPESTGSAFYNSVWPLAIDENDGNNIIHATGIQPQALQILPATNGHDEPMTSVPMVRKGSKKITPININEDGSSLGPIIGPDFHSKVT